MPGRSSRHRPWAVAVAAGYPAMTEIVDAVNSMIELWGPWQDTYANATPGNVGVTDDEVVKESIPDALRELQDAERALAVTDATCRVESGYVDAYVEAEAEIAQEILGRGPADAVTGGTPAAGRLVVRGGADARG